MNLWIHRSDIDLEMMIETHKKLVNSSAVNSKTMNTLLLGGIVNIIHQSEAFEAVEAWAKALEQDNVTNKARIEALETWVLKQNEKINELDDTLHHQEAKKSENQGSESLNQRTIHCNLCEKTF